MIQAAPAVVKFKTRGADSRARKRAESSGVWWKEGTSYDSASVVGYQHDHVVSEFQRTCAQLDRPKVNVLRLWPTTTSGKLVCSGDLILTFSLTSEISHPSPVQGMWVSNFNRTSTPTTFPFASRNALMGHEWTVTGSGGYSLPTSLSMQSEPTIHHMPLSTLENTPPAKRMFCNQPRKARYKRARGRVESETQ